MIWKESLVFLLKVPVSSFIQGLWQDTTKPNHNFSQVCKITKFDYLLRYVRLSDCKISDSTRRTVMKFNIWIFLKNLFRKIKFIWNLKNISVILLKANIYLSRKVRNISKQTLLKIKKHILCSFFFFFEKVALYEIL